MKVKNIFWLVVVGALACGAVKGIGYLIGNKLSCFEKTAHIYVRPGDSIQSVRDSILSKAMPKYPRTLDHLYEKNDVAHKMKPGHYVIEAGRPAVYVVRMLNKGWQTPVRMTLSGTLRSKADIARKISRQMMIDSASVHEALNDRELLKGFGYTPSNVFAMLLPDTYEIYWTASVEEILSVQKEAKDAFWTDENLRKAVCLKLSRMEAETLASIVSGETNCTAEMPKIAGVYLNRLDKGMLLQADPTVAFCYDYKVNRILKYMLKLDSPYNTYKYPGLPPGPICVPSKAALNAVLNSDRGNGNLYFCADPSFNGTHRFARSYSEHMANARAFQKALNSRKK